MPFALISSDGPSEQALADAEAAVRAGIVRDYYAAVRTGDRLAQLAAEYLAVQVDNATPDGPRLVDELTAHLAAA